MENFQSLILPKLSHNDVSDFFNEINTSKQSTPPLSLPLPLSILPLPKTEVQINKNLNGAKKKRRRKKYASEKEKKTEKYIKRRINNTISARKSRLKIKMIKWLCEAAADAN